MTTKIEPEEREEWVRTDDDLWCRWQAADTPLRVWVRLNRKEIDSRIRKILARTQSQKGRRRGQRRH